MTQPEEEDHAWVRPDTAYHAHFDCFSGAAGDMMLAACLDAAGENKAALLRHVVQSLEEGMPELRGEFIISTKQVWRGMGSIAAMYVSVQSKYNHAAAPVPTPSDKPNNVASGHSHHGAELEHGPEHSHTHSHAQHEGDSILPASELVSSHNHSHQHASDSYSHSHGHETSTTKQESSHSHGHQHESADLSHSHSHSHTHEASGDSSSLDPNIHDSESSHSHGHKHAPTSAHSPATHNHNHDHGNAQNYTLEHSHSHQHIHGHVSESRGPLRNLPQIRKMLEEAPVEHISAWVKERAIAAFTALAEAEARTHGAANSDAVHFHEVGAVDSIVDTVGTLIALDALGVATMSCSRLPLGEGTVWTDHGLLPVPAPAALRLMIGMPTCPGPKGVTGELVTPTAAALLKVCVGSELDQPPIDGRPPPFTLRKVGIGAGTKDFQQHPNVVRLMLGDKVVASSHR